MSIQRGHRFIAGSCLWCRTPLRSVLAPAHMHDECSQVPADEAEARARHPVFAAEAEKVAMHEYTEASICEELHALRSDVAACRLTRGELENRLGLLADSLWQTRKRSRGGV